MSELVYKLLTVEQECLLLEADVKHSEVQNLFSLLNGISIFKKVQNFQLLKESSQTQSRILKARQHAQNQQMHHKVQDR